MSPNPRVALLVLRQSVAQVLQGVDKLLDAQLAPEGAAHATGEPSGNLLEDYHTDAERVGDFVLPEHLPDGCRVKARGRGLRLGPGA